MIGLGDGGAHVQFHGGYGYLTKLLGEWVREKQVMTLEQAVRRLTFDSASTFGLYDRGLLRPGMAGRHRDLRPGHREMRQGRGRARLPGRRLAHQGDRRRASLHTIVNGQVLSKTGSTPAHCPAACCATPITSRTAAATPELNLTGRKGRFGGLRCFVRPARHTLFSVKKLATTSEAASGVLAKPPRSGGPSGSPIKVTIRYQNWQDAKRRFWPVCYLGRRFDETQECIDGCRGTRNHARHLRRMGPMGSYPNRLIKIILPHAAGGSPDVMARIIGAKLSQALGQPVVIDNRVGAGGMIGAQVAAASPADGYNLLFTVKGVMAIVPHIYPQAKFNPLRDFKAVTEILFVPHIITATLRAPYNTLQELVDYAKLNPGKIDYASGGVGSQPHVALETLARRTGIKLVHVPYKAPPGPDVISGAVSLYLWLRPRRFLRSGPARSRPLRSRCGTHSEPA